MRKYNDNKFRYVADEGRREYTNNFGMGGGNAMFWA
jgi:hypothetical protein